MKKTQLNIMAPMIFAMTADAVGDLHRSLQQLHGKHNSLATMRARMNARHDLDGDQEKAAHYRELALDSLEIADKSQEIAAATSKQAQLLPVLEGMPVDPFKGTTLKVAAPINEAVTVGNHAIIRIRTDHHMGGLYLAHVSDVSIPTEPHLEGLAIVTAEVVTIIQAMPKTELKSVLASMCQDEKGISEGTDKKPGRRAASKPAGRKPRAKAAAKGAKEDKPAARNRRVKPAEPEADKKPAEIDPSSTTQRRLTKAQREAEAAKNSAGASQSSTEHSQEQEAAEQ